MLVMLFFGYFNELISYLIAVVLHELAHANTAKRLGYAMEEIRLMPYGASIVGDTTKATPLEEIKIAISGPIASATLALFTIAVWWIFPSLYAVTSVFVEVNLCLALSNLMPVYPLDGGRILLALFSVKYERSKAYKRLRLFGYAFAVCLCALFFFLRNPSLATMSAFIFLSTIFPPPEQRYARLFELALSKEGKEIRTLCISPKTKVKSLVRYIRRDKITRFELSGFLQKNRTLDERALSRLPREVFLSADAGKAWEYLQKMEK